MFAAFEGLIPKPISPEDCVFHTKTFQRMNKLRGKQDSIANLMITFAREESGCWTIITPEGVAKLCEVCTILGSFLILEIGGGNGLNAYLIEKYSRELGTPIMVTCTDAQIEDYSKGVLHHAVEKMTADEAVRAYPQMSFVFTSRPRGYIVPAVKILAEGLPAVVAMIGESYGGSCAPETYYDFIEERKWRTDSVRNGCLEWNYGSAHDEFQIHSSPGVYPIVERRSYKDYYGDEEALVEEAPVEEAPVKLSPMVRSISLASTGLTIDDESP